MEFLRQEYWSGLPFPSPEDLPSRGIKPISPEMAGGFFYHTHTHTHTCVKVKSLSCVQFIATPWTVAYQAPPSMGFFRKDYWSGLAFPSPEDLPNLHLYKTYIYLYIYTCLCTHSYIIYLLSCVSILS